MRRIILAITGASGAAYGQRLAACLAAADGIELHLMASPPGKAVVADELGVKPFTVEGLLGRSPGNVTLYGPNEIGARPASGSFRTAGMVICPCSSHTLGCCANGLADNLITRAALVTLKEARRLILVHREMPVSAIDLENMLRLSRAGAVIAPANPGFYMKPQRVEQLVDFVAGRVLDLLDVPHTLDTRWDPRGAAAERIDRHEPGA